MNLKEYLIEAIAKRTSGKYGIEPNKDSIVKWLDENGFVRFDYSNDLERHLSKNFPTYMFGPNDQLEWTNWISIHTQDRNLYELVIWFDKKDNAIKAEIRYGSDNYGDTIISIESAIKRIRDFS